MLSDLGPITVKVINAVNKTETKGVIIISSIAGTRFLVKVSIFAKMNEEAITGKTVP